MTRCRLSELVQGDQAVVQNIEAAGEIQRRLLDMGLVRGTRLTLEKVAPLGDPVSIRLKGFCLSLRKSEAEKVLVERE